MSDDLQTKLKYLEDVAEMVANDMSIQNDQVMAAAAAVGVELADQGHLGDDSPQLLEIAVMLLGGYYEGAAHGIITLLGDKKAAMPDPTPANSGLPPIQPSTPAQTRVRRGAAGPATPTTTLPDPNAASAQPAPKARTVKKRTTGTK